MKAPGHWLFLAGALAAAPARAAEPWPAEAHAAAVHLTDLDAGLNVQNWSGAHWNPGTRTLWLACNSGYFWALVEGGPYGFRVATNAAGIQAKWSPGGDFEGICQADSNSNLVYVMDENGYIREYDVSNYSQTNQTRTWDIRAVCTNTVNAGGEGLAFVPDEFLRRQRFSNSNGVPYVSTNGMGGLMFVGYQQDGYLYALDLKRATGTYGSIGRYQTGRAETADLEFDRRSGKLYVWHNTGSNYLEIVELGSYVDGAGRRLRPLAEYYGPRTGNLEGFAVVPSASSNAAGGCVVTDDNNAAGEAVLWYRQFQPSDDTDADSLSDTAELWHFGSVTQTVGAADDDSDGLSNAAELAAGTDPTNALSVLIQHAPAATSRELVLSWQSATGRTYAIRSATVMGLGFTNAVQAGIGDTAPLNVVTLDVSGLVSNTFFQIVTAPP